MFSKSRHNSTELRLRATLGNRIQPLPLHRSLKLLHRLPLIPLHHKIILHRLPSTLLYSKIIPHHPASIRFHTKIALNRFPSTPFHARIALNRPASMLFVISSKISQPFQLHVLKQIPYGGAQGWVFGISRKWPKPILTSASLQPPFQKGLAFGSKHQVTVSNCL